MDLSLQEEAAAPPGVFVGDVLVTASASGASVTLSSRKHTPVEIVCTRQRRLTASPTQRMCATHSGVCRNPDLIESTSLLTLIPRGFVFGSRAGNSSVFLDELLSKREREAPIVLQGRTMQIKVSEYPTGILLE